MFAFRDALDGVQVAFTDRHGGVSAGPYASLNLAVNADQDADTVEENIDRVAYAFARGGEATSPEELFSLPAGTPVPRVALMRQVHGSDVAEVTAETLEAGESPIADALVTREPGVLLMVRVADCVPVLLADPDAGVVGAAHAGRPGMVSGVVPQVVGAMRRLGAERIRAWVGPHVCGRCYEVPEQMRAEVAASVPESFAETSWGTPALDVGAGVRAQLAAGDVEIVESGPRRCTREDEDLFSYRRQGGKSGRFAGLVWVRP